MKIGLVTIHRSNNYGALMQVFATQYVLKGYGDVHIVDYRNSITESSLNNLRFDLSFKGFLSLGKDLLRLIPRIKVIKSMNRFIESELNVTRQYSATNIDEIDFEEFDVLVCGSDQIWNPSCVSVGDVLDLNYFLSFGKKNPYKLSLSSSAGSYNYSEEQSYELKKCLNSFVGLSCREESLKSYLHELLARSVCHTLDPTLLITSSEWFSIFKYTDDNRFSDLKNYILVYTVPKSTELSRAIRLVKEKLGLIVISIDQGLYTGRGVDMQIRDASPYEFITLFRNAKFVLTDSFHGLCFSLNFKKNFIVIKPKDHSVRIDSLTNAILLDHKAVYTASEIVCASYEDVSQESYSRLSGLKFETLTYVQDCFEFISNDIKRKNI